MSFTANKNINKLLKKASKQGFRIKQKTNHVMVFAKDESKGIITISVSPKSSATKIVECDLKKIGVKL